MQTDIPKVDNCLNVLGTKVLVLIFKHIYDLPTLDRCYNVNRQWRYATLERMKHFEAIVDESSRSRIIPIPRALDMNVKYFRESRRYMEIYNHLKAQYLPNIKFIDLSEIGTYDDGPEMVNMIKSFNDLRALKDTCDITDRRQTFAVYLDNLEALYSVRLDPHTCRPDVGIKLKQLTVDCGNLSVLLDGTGSFRNLERLFFGATEGWVSTCRGRAEMPNVKVLIFHEKQPYHSIVGDLTKVSVALEFMDLCPSTTSAQIGLAAECKTFLVNENIKNYNLIELKLFYGEAAHHTFDSVKKALSKFPRLKRLCIMGNDLLVDDDVEEILDILPDLELLDLRGCIKTSYKLADYVERYCRIDKRKLRFLGKRDKKPMYDNKKYNYGMYRNMFMGSYDHPDEQHFFIHPYFLPALYYDPIMACGPVAHRPVVRVVKKRPDVQAIAQKDEE